VIEIEPADAYNQLLVSHVHPADWINPTPRGRYNLIAIGGGTAGLISALGAAGLGARAAIVERHLLGGDCLNYGCVPSKALIRCARAARQVQLAPNFGCGGASSVQVDFAAVMERMRRLRARISHHDSAQRLSAMGVDVFLGDATFSGTSTIEVGGRRLEFRRAVIATGTRPSVPELDGLNDISYLTNETVFSLTQLPARLLVLGIGPIGCELAQAFRRFGSEVHLVGRREALLPKEDPEAVRVILRQFEEEGIHLHLGWQPLRAERTGDARCLLIERGGERRKILADEILVAVGRRPNVEGLNLEKAGIRCGPDGVEVDDRLRTTNARVFAAGDVCSKVRFTHAADASARLVVRNALFWGRRRAGSLVIPRCTFTDPEVAHVGLTRAEARERHVEIDSFRVALSDVDRAVLDGEELGFAVVHVRRGTGRVVGATIVAEHAGDLIAEVTLLMTRRLSLGTLADTIHCYPTQGEVLKRIADSYLRTQLTPSVAGWLRRWFAWRR